MFKQKKLLRLIGDFKEKLEKIRETFPRKIRSQRNANAW